MKIRKEKRNIEEILSGAKYLGSGASKEAYEKDGVVYKVPRGRYLLQEGGFGEHLPYPNTIDEVDNFLEEVNSYEPALVWPLGQFATELVIWEAIKQLEKEGLEINCFARILDYYLDRQGVPVIVQESTEAYWIDREDEADLWNQMKTELNLLRPILEERFNIILRDIRDGNCGYLNNKLKLFDFGISVTTSLDDYGSYSDCNICDDEYEDYNSYKD